MEEKKLTDEEIVRALEHCCGVNGHICDRECVFWKMHKEISELRMNCQDYMNAFALDLIKRLQQRVSILEADNDDYKMKLAENELVSIDWHNEQVGHLEEENAELQKQVDELKEDLGLKETLYKNAREDGYCTGYKSAVKDTAKEIFETIFYDCWAIKDENGHKIFDEGKMKDFAEKCYGVEVE